MEEEKDEKLEQIIADIREFELSQIKMEEEKPAKSESQLLVE